MLLHLKSMAQWAKRNILRRESSILWNYIICRTFCQLKIVRSICSSSILHKVVPSNLKGKSKSSQDWLDRHLNDPYVKKSRYENYRARSAFKLIEIDDKYQLLKPGMVAVDCGAAPGSWTQVLVKRVNAEGKGNKPKGTVLALDIQHIEAVEGALIMPGVDFRDPATHRRAQKLLGGCNVDIVLSDMAPNATGIKDMDQELIVVLAYSALQFSLKTLEIGGTILCKVWDGKHIPDLENNIKKFFLSVKRVKPSASYTDSAELFLLARDFKGVKMEE